MQMRGALRHKELGTVNFEANEWSRPSPKYMDACSYVLQFFE